MVTSYARAVEYLYRNLPMFQRIGAAAIRADLTNTRRLCAILDHPESKFRSVHVAGTNGKGSTSHMLASILQSAGYKTGLYTSPHLREFTERIRVNGVEVDREFIVDFVNRMDPYIREVKPSFFEITVAMAFEYFAREVVDIAVIEVGLGGRLDSTNVIMPEVSVITNIGWDHKDILGDTLEAIAGEKAGIIKPGRPVIVSERQPAVEHVFLSRARELGSPITFASDNIRAFFSGEPGSAICTIIKDGDTFLAGVRLPLRGIYQEKNVPGVIAAAEMLSGSGFPIGREAVRHGLENVVSQTGLKGRWQQLRDRPKVICDTGHNIDGVREVLRQVQREQFDRLHLVWGMVRDKDISGILALLPKDASYYFCQAKIPRALDAQLLADAARDAALHGLVVRDVNEAYRAALGRASANDLILIGGSTFVVAEIDEL